MVVVEPFALPIKEMMLARIKGLMDVKDLFVGISASKGGLLIIVNVNSFMQDIEVLDNYCMTNNLLYLLGILDFQITILDIPESIFKLNSFLLHLIVFLIPHS